MNNFKHIITILLKNPALVFGGVVMLVLVVGLGFVMTKSQTTTENRSKAANSTVARVYLDGGTDVDATRPGIQVAEKLNTMEIGAARSDVQQIQIKLDTADKKVIAVDLTIAAPEYAIKTIESVKFTGGRANGELFQQMAMLTPSVEYSTGTIRFLVLAKPGEAVTGDGRNIGNLQFQFIKKKTTGTDAMESVMGFSITKASIVTDKEVINITSPNTQPGGQLSFELVNIPNTPTLRPTGAGELASTPTVTPTLRPSATPRPTGAGELVTTPTPLATNTPTPPAVVATATPTPVSSGQGAGYMTLPSATPANQPNLTGQVCAKSTTGVATGWCYAKTSDKKDCYAYNQNARGDGACRNANNTVNSGYMCCSGLTVVE